MTITAGMLALVRTGHSGARGRGRAGGRMRHALFIGCLVLGVLLSTAGNAFAAGALATTQTFHREPYRLRATNPCAVPPTPGTVTGSYNGVLHTTVRPDGTIEITFAGSGRATFVPDAAYADSPSVSLTTAFHSSTSTRAGAFTLTHFIRGVGSDGSVWNLHEVIRGTVDAGGNVSGVTFENLAKPEVACR